MLVAALKWNRHCPTARRQGPEQQQLANQEVGRWHTANPVLSQRGGVAAVADRKFKRGCGACIPPYFVVPLRLDGYPLSKTRDLDLREVLGG